MLRVVWKLMCVKAYPQGRQKEDSRVPFPWYVPSPLGPTLEILTLALLLKDLCRGRPRRKEGLQPPKAQ